MNSLCLAVFIGTFTFIRGDILASIFVKEPEVITQAHEYLKAYSVDTFFTAILFCFIGYYNGCGNTLFVMIQGIVGAMCVRIPVVYLMSKLPDTTLFYIGLGTPASSVFQIVMCLIFMAYLNRSVRKRGIL
ncbi:MAG: MATE family efflux transporter, partial [Lachnospiraceae bacterium]|nr:MATE family efflux transporter [Lachnospiraceae bacterium]